MSEKSAFELLCDAMAALAERDGSPRDMRSQMAVAEATGLPLGIVARGIGQARRMAHRLIGVYCGAEAREAADGVPVPPKGNVADFFLGYAESLESPGKYPAAIAIVATIYPDEIGRTYASEFEDASRRLEERRQDEERRRESYRRYMERPGRRRKEGAGKQWNAFPESTPPGYRPKLCVVFNEPYARFELAYWVRATGEWWFLDSGSAIEVTHWYPVPEPPGGWLPDE